MIYQLTNPLLIPKLMEMARVVPNTPLDKLEKMLISAISDKNSRIYVAEKGGEIKGFMFGSVEEFDGEDVIFIQFAVVKPEEDEKYTCYELLLKFRLWAKESGLKWLYTMVQRNYKPFKRKYGFEPYAMVLRREIYDKPKGNFYVFRVKSMEKEKKEEKENVHTIQV